MIAVVAVVAIACIGRSGHVADGASPSAAEDQLARVEASGVIKVAIDPKDRPQSWYDLTTHKWKGFDVEIAEEIAARLGVKAEFRPADPEASLTGGAWSGLDMEFEKVPVTNAQERLFSFTPAYSYLPASIAVPIGNTSIQDLTTDLNGKRICVGKGTTYESYLERSLSLGDLSPTFDYVIDEPQIERFPTDDAALDNLALGGGARCDAVMTALPTILRYASRGGPVKVVGDPLYYEPFAIAFDNRDPGDTTNIVGSVSQLIQDMHDDGTLASLSEKWYGADLTTVHEGS